MELITFLWEKSETIGLSISLLFISIAFTLYVRYEDRLPLNPHDLLAGTFSPALHIILNSLWCGFLFVFIIFVIRQLKIF